MKTLFALFFILSIAASVRVDAQLLVADTAFTTDVGGGGANASSIFTVPATGTVYGSTSALATFWIADNFTVPAGQTWMLDSACVYAYQTNSSTTSTFTGGYIRIWNGRPDSSGAVVIFGDVTTNRMLSTGWTGVYRVTSTTLTNTARPIMRITVNCGGTQVTQGVYWIEYAMTGSLASGPFTSPKVLPGRINPAGQDGRQRTVSTNTWAAALDVGQALGFNMLVYGQNITGIGHNGSELPMVYSLSQNYPNPFNPTTMISYALPNPGQVNLTVYDALGSVVAVLVGGYQSAGTYEVAFNGANFASGSYYYTLTSGDFRDTKRMILVK